MDFGFFSFALVAGALATVNPCGFIMLPALIAIQLQRIGAVGETDRSTMVLRGLGFGLQATVAFLVVFVVLGLAVSLGARSLIAIFPWAGLFVGVVLVAIGLWSLIGKRPLPIPSLGRQRFGGEATGGFAFGAAYAFASLSCTLPIFLAVVGGTLLGEGLAAATTPLAGYALGMGSVLLVVTLAVALSASTVTQMLRSVMPYVERVGSLLLVVIGGYLVWYWAPLLLNGPV